MGAVVAWSSEVSFSLTLVADRLAEDELWGMFAQPTASACRPVFWFQPSITFVAARPTLLVNWEDR